MALFILRHGETLWNRERRFQGGLDSPLTAKGREQARLYGLALRRTLGSRVPALVSSPLGRAVETMRLACAAAGWDAEACRPDADLQEVSLGEFDGLTRDEIPDFAALPARHDAFDSFFFHCPGGETWDQVAARIDRAFRRLDPLEETVIFLHGVTGKMLRGRALGLDPAAILALDHPQDAFYRMERGRTERIPTAPGVFGPVE